LKKYYFSKEKFKESGDGALLMGGTDDGEEVVFNGTRFGRAVIHGDVINKEWCIEKGNREFKVGDKVRIRQWDDMVKEFGLRSPTYINCNGTFTGDMKYLCGKEIIIRKIDEDGCIQNIDGFNIATDMLEHIEKNELEPQPKGFSTAFMMQQLSNCRDKVFKRTTDDQTMKIGRNESFEFQPGYKRLSPDDRWVEVSQEKEVTFIEAVKAFDKGETIACKNNGLECIYSLKIANGNYMHDHNGYSISSAEILMGRWFIKND